jgi:hypothetical protein
MLGRLYMAGYCWAALFYHHYAITVMALKENP